MFFAAGKVTDFALVAVYGLYNNSACPGRAAEGPRRVFFAAGACGVTTAGDSNSKQVHHREG
jgi:hypothetical protein